MIYFLECVVFFLLFAAIECKEETLVVCVCLCTCVCQRGCRGSLKTFPHVTKPWVAFHWPTMHHSAETTVPPGGEGEEGPDRERQRSSCLWGGAEGGGGGGDPRLFTAWIEAPAALALFGRWLLSDELVPLFCFYGRNLLHTPPPDSSRKRKRR